MWGFGSTNGQSGTEEARLCHLLSSLYSSGFSAVIRFAHTHKSHKKHMEQTSASPCRQGKVTYATGEKNNAVHTHSTKSHWLSVNLSWNCEAAKEKEKMTIMFPALDLGVWMLRRFDFNLMEDFQNSTVQKWLPGIVGITRGNIMSGNRRL